MIIVNALKGFAEKGVRERMELKGKCVEFALLCISEMISLRTHLYATENESGEMEEIRF